MTPTAAFYTRDFTGQVLKVDTSIRPLSYSNAAQGGPREARLRADGDLIALWSLFDLLRCPVEIFSSYTDPVWWGYVNTVTLWTGNLEIGISLDEMYNRVAVAYTLLTTNNTAGARATTAWVQDDESVAMFGIKEVLETISNSTAAHAEAGRNMVLAQRKHPQPTPARISDSASEVYAELSCRGWYDTLGWQYYSNAGTATVDTATQAATMATAEGQFFTEVIQDVTSGILTVQYRDGDSLALQSFEELTEMGTTANRRMLAQVDRARRLRIFEEPQETAPYFIRRDGKLYNEYDVPILTENAPAGIWAKLKDVIPESFDTTKFVDPGLMFIEEATYDCESGVLTLQPRDSQGIEDVWSLQNG